MFMNFWDVSGVFWSFSKCNIKIPHLPADPSNRGLSGHQTRHCSGAFRSRMDMLYLWLI